MVTNKTRVGSARRRELRDFLVARRGAISPQDVGLKPGSRRRTPGLRREEVASLAGVSVSWYTWLEQGREIGVSPEMLDRVAQALRLTPTDTAYLCTLAGVRPNVPIFERADVATLQAAVDGYRAGPAFVTNSWGDIEAYNDLADYVFRFDSGVGPFARNHIWRMFMDPDRRAVYADWRSMAEMMVGYLRTAAGYSGTEQRRALIRELVERSDEFANMWHAQRTAALTAEPVRLDIPQIGQVAFTSLRLQYPGADAGLFLLLVPTNRDAVDAMRRLSTRLRRRALARLGPHS